MTSLFMHFPRKTCTPDIAIHTLQNCNSIHVHSAELELAKLPQEIADKCMKWNIDQAPGQWAGTAGGIRTNIGYH
jgi:hypothetical protein